MPHVGNYCFGVNALCRSRISPLRIKPSIASFCYFLAKYLIFRKGQKQNMSVMESHEVSFISTDIRYKQLIF